MKEAQQVVAEKTGTLEAEAYKTRRLQEELAQLKRRVERLKKIEAAGTADEVLREELREYKDTLTCPSCKVTRKDAVLTKCFHVFCFDCLRTRYETRQRKCPKCNAAFGANDYHRLYLSWILVMIANNPSTIIKKKIHWIFYIFPISHNQVALLLWGLLLLVYFINW